MPRTETHFETYLNAVEKCPDRQGILGDDDIVFPPEADSGYEATPRNALTFAAMGVDGVHYVILKIDGKVTNDSPILHVGPMDFSEPYIVLGSTFLDYLTTACGVSEQEMQAVFDEERAGKETLLLFLAANFQHERLYDETRIGDLSGYLECIESTPVSEQPTELPPNDCPICAAKIVENAPIQYWNEFHRGGGYTLFANCPACNLDMFLTVHNGVAGEWSFDAPDAGQLVSHLRSEEVEIISRRLHRYESQRPKWTSFLERVRSGDELWRYKCGGISDATGIAIVRKGRPIARFEFGSL